MQEVCGVALVDVEELLWSQRVAGLLTLSSAKRQTAGELAIGLTLAAVVALE